MYISEEMKNVMHSVHGKEWDVPIRFFTMQSNNRPYMWKTRLLKCMSDGRLEFPLERKDNLNEIIQLFLDIGGDEIGTRALLFILAFQKNKCVDVIDKLVNIQGIDFVTKLVLERYHITDSFDSSEDCTTLLITACQQMELTSDMSSDNENSLSTHLSPNPSTEVILRLIDIGGRDLVMQKNSYGDNILKAGLFQSENPSLEVMSKLIDIGGRDLIMQKNGNGDNALLAACRGQPYNPSIEMIAKLIEIGGRELVTEKSLNGSNPLIILCQMPKIVSIEVISMLIKIGGRELVMQKNSNGDNALFVALWSKNPSAEIILKLIEIGGYELVMEIYSFGNNVLMEACQSDNLSVEVIFKLIEIGGRDLVMRTNNFGENSLHAACGALIPSLEVVSGLIEIGGRDLVMQTNDDGNNAFTVAHLRRNPSNEVRAKLIDIGGKELVMQTNSFEDNLLMEAFMSDNPSVEFILKLIEIGGRELVMKKSKNGFNALMAALRSQNPSIEVISRLIETGGKELIMRKANKQKVNVLFVAIQSHDASMKSNEVILKLIEIGGRELVMEKNKKKCNVLLVVFLGQFKLSDKVILKLIETGGKELLIQKNGNGDNALIAACRSYNPSVEVVSKLIEIGGRDLFLQKDSNGDNVLIIAACHSYNPSPEVISKLIEIGGREMMVGKNKDGNDALIRICQPYHRNALRPIRNGSTHPNIIRVLISEGVRLKLGGEFGIGGLFITCFDSIGDDIIDPSPRQPIYDKWFDVIVPALDEETQFLLYNQPILQAAIMHKSPSNIIQDIINRLTCCVSFRDSIDRYPIAVAIQEGMQWNEGLKIVVHAVAALQGRSIMNVVAHYGVTWENGVEEVFEENKAEIRTVDGWTGFYPFMLAAVGESWSSDLDSIFSLAKEEPGLVRLYSY